MAYNLQNINMNWQVNYMKHRFSSFYSQKFIDFEDFMKSTGGFLYIEQPDGQLEMKFIKSNEDLIEYSTYFIINIFNCNLTLHITIKKEN